MSKKGEVWGEKRRHGGALSLLLFLLAGPYSIEESFESVLCISDNQTVSEILEGAQYLCTVTVLKLFPRQTPQFHGLEGCPRPCSIFVFSFSILESISFISCLRSSFSASNPFLYSSSTVNSSSGD